MKHILSNVVGLFVSPEASDDEVSEETSDVFPKTAEVVSRMGELLKNKYEVLLDA